MTKEEAIEHMLDGTKVTHKYFSDDEWVTIKNGLILLEDGITCTSNDFWKYRQSDFYNNGWELFK